MFPYKQSNYASSNIYQHYTIVPDPWGVPQGNQPFVSQRQPVNPRQTRVHYTGYNRELTTIQVCRCAQPERHGDAFSYGESHAIGRYIGAQFLDLQGQELDHNECYHRCFDIIGKDFVNTKAELEAVFPQVMHPDIVRALEAGRGRMLYGICQGAIWYGSVNPKGCVLLPPPEQYWRLRNSENELRYPMTGREGMRMPPRGQSGYYHRGFRRR